MFASKDIFLTPPSGGYTIARSVRLRSSASAYFNRTPATTTNQKTWTWSGWVKRGALSSGSYMDLFSALSGANDFTEFRYHYNTNDDTLVFSYVVAGTGYYVSSTNVFRDPSAWYHLVCSIDTTQATAANRVKIYVNGVQVSYTTTGYPPQNSNTAVNATNTQNIGNINTYGRYFDGYLTEINFIDGQALTPSSFGSTNAITGVWQPAKYTGTYGTNGFYLNFSDNSSNTATTIGKDYSGNGNNWTPNNISVTSGVTYDSMVDSPTVGSLSSNYATLNPLDVAGTAGSITDGNLKLTGGSAAWYQSRSGFGMTAGKWYWEVTIISANTTSNGICLGISNSSTQTVGVGQSNQWVYNNNTGGGRKSLNGTVSAYGATYVANDVVGIAFDADAGSITCYVNNSSQGVMASSGLPNPAFPVTVCYGSDNVAINFGQRPFSYTPPTGFVALNTYNLPASTIKNGAAYMAATLYTGNSGTQNLSNAVSGISFQPDFVWIKDRTNAVNHQLYDSVRGVSLNLHSNTTGTETSTPGFGVTAFASNGATIVDSAANYGVNFASDAYVAWQWKAGTTSASNTNGSITSTVSVGATQGFSVVTYTGTGVNNATVGHGLGVAPSMIIVKSRTQTYNWDIYHQSLGITATLIFTTAATRNVNAFGTNNPTSSVFSVYSGYTNDTSANLVAYCFAAVAGYSAFGSYTGNSSTDGTFVYTGFRPRFVMVKGTGSGGSGWQMQDSSRNTYNPEDAVLRADLSNAESTGYGTVMDFLSNGFKLRVTDTNYNSSSTTYGPYIYMAFAENPFKNSLAR